MKQQKVSGNILLFYAFDVGDDIDLQKIKEKSLLPTYKVPQSPYFKDYHVPLAFRIHDQVDGKLLERQDAILNKVHHYGVVSFCYKIPFNDSFDRLKQRVIDVKAEYDKKSEEDAKHVCDKISSAVVKPNFYNLKNDYYAVHVNPIEGPISAEEFKEEYGSKIASLLRLETGTLAQYQQDEILESTTGYYGQDLIIIDGEASFVYDDEYYEPMEFFESATIQQLELQYYDRVLDKRLNYFYKQKNYQVPLKAYIPLLGHRVELPAAKLVRLRVDISVITERLESSIKMSGDVYYLKLHSMLVEKLSLQKWRDSINRKLDIIGDLHQAHQSHFDIVHEEMLTVVIIVLIAIELIVAVVGHG